MILNQEHCYLSLMHISIECFCQKVYSKLLILCDLTALLLRKSFTVKKFYSFRLLIIGNCETFLVK